jgi:hypothetical protein
LAKQKQPTTISPSSSKTAIYQMPDEELRMNRWQVIYILRGVRDEQKRVPEGGWCVATLALTIALALPLITADFKDALGMPKATWQSVDVILTGFFAVATVVLFLWWGIRAIWFRARSEEKIVQDLMDEMLQKSGGA